jgi:hypothetical protein
MQAAEIVVTEEEIVLTDTEEAFAEGFYVGFGILYNVMTRKPDGDSFLLAMGDKLKVTMNGISRQERVKKLINLYEEYKNAQEAH